MVARAAAYIQPGDVCDCCGHQFEPGDSAIVLVNARSAEFDTLCFTDWAVILASSSAWLKEHGDAGQDGLKSLLVAALGEIGDELVF